MSLHDPDSTAAGSLRFRIYRTGPAVSLSEVLPVLQHMGVEVTDERPYELERGDGAEARIYDFGLRTDGTEPDDVGLGLRTLFEDTFAAVRAGLAESDTLNRLVLHGGLTWRQITVLRAYV